MNVSTVCQSENLRQIKSRPLEARCPHRAGLAGEAPALHHRTTVIDRHYKIEPVQAYSGSAVPSTTQLRASGTCLKNSRSVALKCSA